MPALAKVVLVFVVIVLLIKKKLSLGNTFFIGSVLLGILFGLGPVTFAGSILSSLADPKTVSLATIVTLILVLSNSMETAGQMERLLKNFRGLIKNPKLNIILFPAMIGLLPMPGGAIFSAPMVKQIGNGSNYSPDQLSFVNYWFRHIWEYWWPLYPGVLLTVVLADLNLGKFVACMFPLTFLAVFMGFTFLKGEHQEPSGEIPTRPSVWPFIMEIMPILIVIVPGIGLGMLIRRFVPGLIVGKEIGLSVALVVAILWVWRKNDLRADHIKKLLINPKLLNLVYMIAAILVFKGVLEDSKAIDGITRELMAIHAPLLLIVTFLPFLVGLVTGITIAFVGSVFPILLPLIHSIDPSGNVMPYVMLALVCGFSGVMLSPVHLCLILSNEYFETDMGKVYKHLRIPCFGLILAGLLYHFFLKIFIWGR